MRQAFRTALAWALIGLVAWACPPSACAAARANAGGASAGAHEESVTLNFRNADIRAVIEFVARHARKNILVDNRVKGQVTIISPAPVPLRDLYQVFLSILALNGFTAVDDGKVVKIVPMAEGKQRALPVSESGSAIGGDALVTRLVGLRRANAAQLQAALRPLMSPVGALTAYAPANMLILTDTAAVTDKILRIARAMDEDAAARVRLLRLRYASAERVAQTLSRLYQAGAGGAGLTNVRVLAHPSANMLAVVAPVSIMREIVSLARRLDQRPRAGEGRLRVRYLKNANAEDTAKVLNKLISQTRGAPAGAAGGKGAPVFAHQVNIVADPATNALLITADPDDQKQINALIDKLDIRRLQVLVEALIVEISTDDSQQFGMEFRGVGDFTQPGRRAIGGTSFTNQAGTNIGTVAANPLNPGNGLAVGVVSGTITFAGTQFLNLGALMRALESKTNANVLSTPDILTMDNEEAEIIVGQNVPFVTGQNVTQGGTANPFQTIQRQDVGLTLRVTPQISEGDAIRLKIYQEISSVRPKGQAADIITDKRSIKTTVLANDGNIIVLGGLIRDDGASTVQRVPCIGAVPVLGEPFRFTENTHRKTNLMVFLRPHIIRGQHDIDAITSEKYREIEDIYHRQPYEGTLLFHPDRPPLPAGMKPGRSGPDTRPPAKAKR